MPVTFEELLSVIAGLTAIEVGTILPENVILTGRSRA
jgi:hypothetical protein